MNDLSVGVIGGMGPDATVDFMARVLALTPATEDQEHIHLLVDQNPKIPNRQQAILGAGENPGPCLAAMAARLEACDCDFLVMPCNTAHVFLADILAATRIPLVSIIEVTMQSLEAAAVNRVGLLASAACIEARVYQQAMEATGKAPVLQTADELAELGSLIAAIKTGEHGADLAARMRALAERLMQRGAEAIIVGCTEIPIVLKDTDVRVPLLSSTDILAEHTVALAKRQRPLPRR
ncbi:MAG: amino acid racemase [Pseudomonadota bacterium]